MCKALLSLDIMELVLFLIDVPFSSVRGPVVELFLPLSEYLLILVSEGMVVVFDTLYVINDGYL